MSARWRWLPVVLLACAAFSSAGMWQYGRGVEKRAFLQAFEAGLVAAPQPLAEALAKPVVLPRPVAGSIERVEGAPWLLLDNSRRGQQVGLRALAAYRASADGVLLVDFGWLPMPPGRQLPGLEPPPARVEARGLLQALPGQGLRLGGNVWPDGPVESVLLAYLDPAEVETAFGQPLYAGLLRLDPALPVGFMRDLDALPNTLPPEKHFGYALQWFGFAAATAVIYLVLAFRKRQT